MADSKLADLTEDTNPAANDWLYKVANAGTSGSDRKVKISTVSGERLIASSVLGADTASVTFSSIPGTFETLHLVVWGRSTRSNPSDAVNVRFNSDSGANYYDQYFDSQGSTTLTGSDQAVTSFYGGRVTSATGETNSPGFLELFLPGYARTTWHKVGIIRTLAIEGTSSTGVRLIEVGARWANTAAITDIYLAPAVGSWKAGTALYLYGLVT